MSPPNAQRGWPATLATAFGWATAAAICAAGAWTGGLILTQIIFAVPITIEDLSVVTWAAAGFLAGLWGFWWSTTKAVAGQDAEKRS